MRLIVDPEHRGPSEASWLKRLECTELGPLGLLHSRRLIVVAPHPDDEVLGAGGLIQHALKEHVLVEVIAVTDGEASHPHSEVARRLDVASVRARETREALHRLGWERPVVTRLHLPDGKVAEHRDELDEALSSILLPDDLCVAPWRRDGHPDHEACGGAAARAAHAVGARSLGYLIWTWHWADPDGTDIPWERCRRLDLDRRARARKRWSTGAFRSQVAPLGDQPGDAAILPEHVVRRFWRSSEVFVDEGEEK